MHPAYFIAGTDTGIGKTFCTTALLHAAKKSGLHSTGYKPVATEADENGWNEDVSALRAASSEVYAYQDHNGYTFREATAPHLAAVDENRPINTACLSEGLAKLKQKSSLVLVEGAGGWLTPLDDETDFADWVVSQQLPVILVVGMKLGCINHALLAVEAIRHSGLELAGWVANCITAQPHRLEDYLDTLVKRIPAPLLGLMPYMPGARAETVAEFLDIGLLD
ncbi:TPA: dethiobiotin synthase [Neisseria weaveri]